jgi:uncharacterized protein (TIGR03083 family)
MESGGGVAIELDEAVAGPWEYAPQLLSTELELYLAEAGRPAIRDLPTRCAGWDVRAVTVHLVCTFSRFRQMLAQGRGGGDFSAPFAADELAAENQRAVGEYAGTDPGEELRVAVREFGADLRTGEEPMPHQHGPIPVALQVLFGINELAIHHDDVAAAAGSHYAPSPQVLDVLRHLWRRRGIDVQNWDDIILASGRQP